MEKISETIKKQGGNFRELPDFEPMSPEATAQNRIDSMNQTPGDRNKIDGYNCNLCMNRGYFMKLFERNGIFYETAYDCKCAPIRRSIIRMKKSGLQDVIRDCTFDKWETLDEWQRNLKDVAMDYAKNPINILCQNDEYGYIEQKQISLTWRQMFSLIFSL